VVHQDVTMFFPLYEECQRGVSDCGTVMQLEGPLEVVDSLVELGSRNAT
jgi:hypothetical protein